MTAPTQDTQARFAAAAAQAAAVYAAAKAGQDVSAVVAHAVSVSANTSRRAIDAATAMIVGLWRITNPADQWSVDRFVAQAGRVIVSAQKAAASAASAAQLTQVQALGINVKVAAVTIPDDVRGAHVQFGADIPTVQAPAKAAVEYQPATEGPRKVKVIVRKAGATADRVFNRAVVTYHYERSQGADHVSATAAGEDRIAQIVDANVTLAQRLGEQQTLAQVAAIDSRIIGWRRVIRPELSKGGVCGLCVAASDRVYRIQELKPIHARCKCAVAAVTKSKDPGHRLNQDDLGMLYEHAGTTSGRTPGMNLKRTRYVIEHHHELGPVLTRVRGEKVPYYSTTPSALTA